MSITPIKTTKLRAKKPEEIKESKPKILIYGESGVGKTFFSLAFPKPFYIDVERGAVRSQYVKRLMDSGGAYMGPDEGSNDFPTVIEQFKLLASEDHDYQTIVIDSFSKLFSIAIANEAARLNDRGIKNEFGADKKPAVQMSKQLANWINRIDMNVLLICHEIAEWGSNQSGERVQIGTTFDGWPKLKYELDLAFNVRMRGPSRSLITIKSRIDKFPQGDSMELSYEKFAERYGFETINKAVSKLRLATNEQVAEVKTLLDVVKVDEETVQKWFTKAGVESFNEMNEADIGKCIAFLKSKVNG